MYRDILTNKWFLAGIGFLVVFAGACYLYYQHETTPLRQQATEPNEIIQQSEKQQTAETANPAKAAADASVGSITPNTEKPINGTIDVVKGDTLLSETHANLTEQTQETEKSEDRVSPHGFGRYPDVPPDYPAQDVWDYPDYISAEAEILLRVQIKLWTQGTRTLGGIMSDGLVYSTLPGVVYVEWDHKVLSDGTMEKYVSRVRGDPHTGKILSDIKLRKGKLVESDIPQDIEVREKGIDPYQFLNLK